MLIDVVGRPYPEVGGLTLRIGRLCDIAIGERNRDESVSADIRENAVPNRPTCDVRIEQLGTSVNAPHYLEWPRFSDVFVAEAGLLRHCFKKH